MDWGQFMVAFSGSEFFLVYVNLVENRGYGGRGGGEGGCVIEEKEIGGK